MPLKTLTSKLFTKVTPVIAVDLGVKVMKVLQVSPGAQPSLIAAAEHEIPDEISADGSARFDYQLSTLPEMLKKGGFEGRRIVCGIPSAMMFCKHMRFARTDGVPLSEMVKTAVSSEIGCHPDALVYRQVEVGEVGGGPAGGAKQEVICLATRRDFVNRIMKTLAAARLEPVGLHPEPMAMLHGFDRATRGKGEEDKTTMYLDLGAGTTQVLLVHGGKLRFAKSIHVAGIHLDHAISKQMGCSLLQARSRRLASPDLCQRAGAPARPVPAGAGAGLGDEEDGEGDDPRHPRLKPTIDLSEQLETMTDEILMCLRYYESVFPGARAERAVFVGGEARHRPLCEYIARRLRMPAQVADPLSGVKRTGKEPCDGLDASVPQPGWAVVYGLALCPTDV
jgi:type IV pilus assembly protein PilM